MRRVLLFSAFAAISIAAVGVTAPGLTAQDPIPPGAKIIARETRYFQEHQDHLHYSAMEKAGAPMGSGAVESLGKQLQRRLRGCGQFWSRPGLTNLLHLSVLVKNIDLHHLWN